jgi:hypothetical protein
VPLLLGPPISNRHSMCNRTPEGVLAIATAIEVSSLTTINLSGCAIGGTWRCRVAESSLNFVFASLYNGQGTLTLMELHTGGGDVHSLQQTQIPGAAH